MFYLNLYFIAHLELFCSQECELYTSLTMANIPITAIQRRRLDVGVQLKSVQLYGVNCNATRFILPLEYNQTHMFTK